MQCSLGSLARKEGKGKGGGREKRAAGAGGAEPGELEGPRARLLRAERAARPPERFSAAARAAPGACLLALFAR